MKLAFDLHLHSCLSPCADGEMTPATVAGLSKLAGAQVVALTDHNTCGNCAAFCQAAQEYGLLALPGMELCTREEVHVVCLLPDLAQAEAFDRAVKARLPGENDPAVFGRQVRMDADDHVLGEEPALLVGAADIGVYEVAGMVAAYGGVAWPAHIDRPSFSLLSNLGFWDSAMGFPLAEVSVRCPPDFATHHPDLAGVRLITGSDAHRLEQMPQSYPHMDVPDCSAAAVLNWLKHGK